MSIKTYIEKRAVACLYNRGFNQSGRINKKNKKICFEPMFSVIFKHFADPSQKLAITVLIKWYGYGIYEQNLITWCSVKAYKPQMKHTWGEIQDIIRSYNTIPGPKPMPFKTREPLIGQPCS